MQAPLLSGGKLATSGSTIVCDTPEATILSGRTQNTIQGE